MERSFAAEVKQLALGAGQVLRGEGILAITKALLQSGVSDVGGYPGAPVSHLLVIHPLVPGEAGGRPTELARLVSDARGRMLEDEKGIDGVLESAGRA
jgi:hypothetical protein